MLQKPEHMNDDEYSAYNGIMAAKRLAYETSLNAGWHKNPNTGEDIQRNFGEAVALMHSELSEALEAHRKGLMDSHLSHRNGIEVEFADLIIRVLDICGALTLDIEGALIEKNRYNKHRADHKLENRKNNGKKY
jgi:hypothetical protein